MVSNILHGQATSQLGRVGGFRCVWNLHKIPFLFNFCNFPPCGLERRAVSSWVGSGYRRPISVPPVRLPYYVSRGSIAHTFS